MKTVLKILSIFTFLLCCSIAGAETYQPVHDGAIIPCADGHALTLINNNNSKVTSYNGVMNFVKGDKTNDITTSDGVASAEKLHNIAEVAGLKCGVTLVAYKVSMHADGKKSYYGKAVDVFPLDNGSLLYIDPTNGCVAHVVLGDAFSEIGDNGSLILYNGGNVRDIWTAW